MLNFANISTCSCWGEKMIFTPSSLVPLFILLIHLLILLILLLTHFLIILSFSTSSISSTFSSSFSPSLSSYINNCNCGDRLNFAKLSTYSSWGKKIIFAIERSDCKGLMSIFRDYAYLGADINAQVPHCIISHITCTVYMPIRGAQLIMSDVIMSDTSSCLTPSCLACRALRTVTGATTGLPGCTDMWATRPST